MGWFEWTEQRRKLLTGGVSVIGLLALLVCARRKPISFDSFWHLQMGKDLVEKGLSPFVDHYSFTFQGAEISSVPVLFQVLLYWFVSLFGDELGYQLLKAVLFSLILGLLIVYLKQIRAPVVVYCIALPMLVALIELRAMVRPELISYALIVAAMMLYRVADQKVSPRTAIPIVLLIWFWSNYHSAVIGYVIFFGFFIDAGYRLLTERAPSDNWLRWLGWGVLVVVVGAVTPGWSHPLYEQLRFDPRWISLIQEYRSPLLYKNIAAVYALMVIAIMTTWLCWRQRRFGYLAIILIMAYASSTMARMVTPAGIAVVCIFSHVATQIDLRSWLNRVPRWVGGTAGILALALFGLSMWTSVSLARAFMRANLQFERLFPSDVVQYMKENDLSGNIFNEYQAGGYLIYHLSPDSRIYIDGRTNILYPIDHYHRMLVAQVSPDVFSEEVATYDISLVVLETFAKRYWLMGEVEEFGLEFMGANYSLYTKGDSNLEKIGRLLGRPACWSPTLLADLKSEEMHARLHLAGDSSLWPFLGLAMDYSNAEDRAAFIRELDTLRAWEDSSLRFVAYRALEHGEFKLAASLLSATEHKEPKDYLAAAWALAQVGELERAENTLELASHTNWIRMELADYAIVKELVRQLGEDSGLDNINQTFLSVAEDRLAASDLGSVPFKVDSKLLCAEGGWRNTR